MAEIMRRGERNELKLKPKLDRQLEQTSVEEKKRKKTLAVESR